MEQPPPQRQRRLLLAIMIVLHLAREPRPVRVASQPRRRSMMATGGARGIRPPTWMGPRIMHELGVTGNATPT